MVRLNSNLYFGDLAKLQKEAILNSLKLETAYPGVYFLTLAANKIEQLDIVGANMYFSPSADKRKEIVGIAYGKREALRLVARIADDVYRNKAASDFREYFGDR